MDFSGSAYADSSYKCKTKLLPSGQDYFLLPGDSEGKIMVAATFILCLGGNYSQSKVLLSI